jgi:hypothetical protein
MGHVLVDWFANHGMIYSIGLSVSPGLRQRIAMGLVLAQRWMCAVQIRTFSERPGAFPRQV